MHTHIRTCTACSKSSSHRRLKNFSVCFIVVTTHTHAHTHIHTYMPAYIHKPTHVQDNCIPALHAQAKFAQAIEELLCLFHHGDNTHKHARTSIHTYMPAYIHTHTKYKKISHLHCMLKIKLAQAIKEFLCLFAHGCSSSFAKDRKLLLEQCARCT